MSKRIYRVGGLFSGVGGIELGFLETNKFKVAWSTDNDPSASKTHKENFSHPFFEEDIYSLNAKQLEPVDVLVAGFPCQAFSVAGYRKGFEDERGNVFFQIIRVIQELSEKPKIVFLENVKNIKGHDGGRTFKQIQKSLEDEGYCVFLETMNTFTHTGIPQNRERAFIVGILEGKDALFDLDNRMTSFFRSAFPLRAVDKVDSIKQYLEPGKVPEKYYYREDKYNFDELNEVVTKDDTVYQWRRVYVRENKKGVCHTLTANMGTGGHNVPLIRDKNGIRKLTPKECFNLQGFPKDFKFPENTANSHLYKQAGNSVTVALIRKCADVIFETLEASESVPVRGAKYKKNGIKKWFIILIEKAVSMGRKKLRFLRN